MKELIANEIVYQKIHNPQDVKLIQRYQQMLDRDTFDIKDFQDTGIIIPRKAFEESFLLPPELHDNCTDVMRYIGGYIIQLLNIRHETHNHYLKFEGNKRGTYSSRIQELETLIWKRIK